MNRRLAVLRVISICFVSLMLTGLFTPAMVAGQQVEVCEVEKPIVDVGYDLESIYIFYDRNDDTMQAVGEGVREILSVLISSVRLVPVDSYDDVEFWLLDEPWIAVYALPSSLDGVCVQDGNRTWYQFYKTLSEHRSTQHVVGMGNTKNLAPYLKTTDTIIRHSNIEQADGLLVTLYDAWTVSEVIVEQSTRGKSYEDAGTELQRVLTQVYADNFEALFRLQYEPQNPVGEMDPKAAEKRVQAMWDRHPGTVEPTAYELDEDGGIREVEEETIPEHFTPEMRLSSEAELSSSDFFLGFLPKKSGLRGPIGKIVDVLLQVLFDGSTNALSIPTGTMTEIMETFEEIVSFLGVVDSFESESPMKSIILALQNEFPFPEDLKNVLTPITQALFDMRGDQTQVLSALEGLLDVLLPGSVPSEAKDYLVDLLDIEDLWSVVSDASDDGKGVFDAVLCHLSSRTIDAVLSKVIIGQLGVSPATAATLLDRTDELVEGLTCYLSTFDFDNFIQTVGRDLLQVALADLTQPFILSDGFITSQLDEALLNKIMLVVRLVMTALDLVNNFDAHSVVDVVADILEHFFGSSCLSESARSVAYDLLDVINLFSEGANPSTPAFQDEVISIIDSVLTCTVSASVKNTVVSILTTLCGIYNSGLNPADVPSVFEGIAELVNAFAAQYSYTLADASSIIEAIDGAVKPLLAVVAYALDDDGLKRAISRTVSAYQTEFGSPGGVIKDAVLFLDREGTLDSVSGAGAALATFGDTVAGAAKMIGDAKGQSFQGVVQAVLMMAGSVLGSFSSFDDVPVDAYLTLMEYLFPEAYGFSLEDAPWKGQVLDDIMGLASGIIASPFDETSLESMIETLLELKGLFTNGVEWLLGKVYDWLTGQVTPLLDSLESTIRSVIASDDLLGVKGDLPIGLGDWSLFVLEYDLAIQAQVELDESPFFEMVRALIFSGKTPFELDTLEDFFDIMFTFLEITPQFRAELGISGLDTAKNKWLGFILGLLGADLSFEGSAHFVLNLFVFREGMFQSENFMKVVEWGLHIKVTISRMYTVLDIFTGGIGGGVTNALAKVIGLDAINIVLSLSAELDIVKKAATAIAPEVSTLTLVLTIGAALNIRIKIPTPVGAVIIRFKGALEISLSFFQDLASSAPMEILLRLVFTITLQLKYAFAKKNFKWTWEPGGPWDLSPKKGEAEYENSGIGFDQDDDGLSDEYEDSIPGLDKTKADTDGDGANDKLEVNTMDTDPVVPDTDGDGLLDGREWELGTNPLFPDTDWDDLTDYQEVEVYGTDPFTQDTDGDGLTDAFEVYTRWDISGVTPTVTEVKIGGTSYNDHTDPLVADTDGDGLVDGDEGPTGCYYGLDSLYNDTEDSGFDPDPLIFNEGYTHPLDADTDDDSYLQLYNGDIDRMLNDGDGQFLIDMNDGAEVAGFVITVLDEDSEPEKKHVFTNPCNPDTDGDTGITDRTPQPAAWLSSDGYELAQNPPTDPTDGDSDDDGLLDGLEGVLNQWSNHTDPWDPDTDDDGLYDMQELLLGTSPRMIDSDLDMVSDGDEFYRFFTNPNLADSDFDGLSDGEELYYWHSNPLLDDSDGDKLSDYHEVVVYNSDPNDEDTDNDGLTDFEEIMIYYTNPFTYDCDSDGLSDGEEILVYETNPLLWDSDNDTLWEPDKNGDPSFPMSDYHEVMIYGTNATDPDSDLDGLGDGIELYLASGIIPWMDPIPLDAMDNDTDDDYLIDGQELYIANSTDIYYPFVAHNPVFRYNTSPVLRDTDNDTLIDYQEVMVFNSLPDNPDSDNDTLSDFDEIWIYNTSAIANDTDGDGLFDWEETLEIVEPYGPWPPSNWSVGIGTEEGTLASSKFKTAAVQIPGDYDTLATDSDCDGDWLPDGAEVHFYGTEPLDTDSDNDGVDDTYEFDTDFDGLPDGLEFKLGTQTVAGGGIHAPDSDYDGLLDGDEYYVYGTDPTSVDTDGDGYSDGFEIMLGLDPLSYTTRDEFESALAIYRGQSTIQVLSPANGATVGQFTAVSAANLTPFQDMWFRFENGTGWSDDYSLEYMPTAQQWQSTEVVWSPGTYRLQVFGRNMTGVAHAQEIAFIVTDGFVLEPWMLLLIIGAVAVVTVSSGLFYYKKRREGSSETKSSTKDDSKLDLTDIPGVGSSMAAKLKSAGYKSVDKLAATSVEDLSEVEGVGTKKAEKIIEEAKKLKESSKKSGGA